MARSPGPITGAVLAGGRAERLGGRSKALLPLGAGGSPVVAATVALLAEVASPVLVSVRDRAQADSLGAALDGLDATPIVDAVPGAGPLAGLAAVLDASPHDRVIVVACDMPSLSRPLVERLVALSFEHAGATAVVPRTDRGLHPLHAVYRRSLLAEVQKRLDDHRLALHDLLAATSTLEVAEEELRLYDPGLVSFENVNTPEDLDRALARRRTAR